MAGASIGTAYLTLVPKMQSGWKAQAESELTKVNGKKSGETVGKEYGNGLTSMVKKGVGALAALGIAEKVFDFGKASVEAYAQTEQLTGGIDKLFGNSGMTIKQYAQSAGESVKSVTAEYEKQAKAAQLVKDNAASAYKSAGMSANDYMETTISISAALKNSLGGDSEKAAKQADKAVKQMADNVNTYGAVPIENIRQAYQGFARQNYTMLDNLSLGYAGSKEGMEALIKDANEYAKAQGKSSNLTIDSYSDIIDAIELIQEKQGIAGTTAKEAATTIEGSVSSAGAAWENWLSGLANEDADMKELTGQLADSVVTAMQNILPKVGEVFSNVGDLLSDYLLSASNEVGPTLASVDWGSVASTVFSVLSSILSTVFVTIGQTIASLGSVIGPAISDAFDGAVSAVGYVMNELGNEASMALGLAIGAITSSVTDAASGIADGFLSGLSSIGTGISGVFGSIAGTVSSAFSGIVSTVSGIVGGIASVVSSAFSGIGSAMSAPLSVARGVVSAACNGIKGAFAVFNGIKSTVSGIFNGVKNAISSPLNTAKSLVKSAIDKISGIINGAKLSLPHFKLPHFNISAGQLPWGIGGKGKAPSISVDWYAKGGVFESAQVIGIGEAGREAALPLNNRTYSEIAKGITDQGATTNSVVINLNYSADADANQMVRDIAAGLRRLQMTGA